jgi:membrane AbrB-like protein
MVLMAGAFGADQRLVAFMQYLRVLVVVLIAPVLAHVVLHHGGHAGAAPADHAGVAADLAFTAGCTALGLLVARATGLTAGSLLLPLIIAAAASITGVAGGADVPSLVEEIAFAAIGLQVGLRFTVATIRHAGRLLPATLASIVALIAACAGLAVVLERLGGFSFADAYLATTPGGIYAVLAAAAGAGANTTFVVAVQALRVFVMVLAAPPLVRAITRERGRAAGS